MSQFFSSGSHWYALKADGTIEAQHDADLRDARKAKLFPSVTTVLKERSNPQLEQWKINQVYQAVVANPAQPGEDMDAYKARIAEISGRRTQEAADFGTRLHDALEHYPQMPLDVTLQPWLDAFGPSWEKIVAETVGSEFSLADPEIGVAGRTDKLVKLHDGRLAIADFKTQRFGSTGKANFWASFPIQLSFYARAYAKANQLEDLPAIMSVAINSEKPEKPQFKIYTEEEQDAAYAEFLATAFLWFSTKKYWPVGQWELEVFVQEKAVYP